MVVPNWAGQVAMPKGEWCKLDLSSMNTKVQKNDIQAQLLQRPGSVIPIANLAQSTTELRTDSLTLLVCLDDNLQATGTLYEDDGDGFGYRNGDYRLSRITAKVENKRLTVSIGKAEGLRDETPRILRIGYMRRGKLLLSPWQEASSVTMKYSK